jgi:hypothetical protein
MTESQDAFEVDTEWEAAAQQLGGEVETQWGLLVGSAPGGVLATTERDAKNMRSLQTVARRVIVGSWETR